MDDEIAEVVREHGWFAASISDHEPPFLYTIGLLQSFNHPELIIFGLDSDNSYALFSQLVRDIRATKSYAAPGVYAISIGEDEHRIAIRPVHFTQHELYLGFALGYYRDHGNWDGLVALQVFWPESSGKFPYEVGCASEVYRLQPRLELAVSPLELKKWRRQWE